MKVCPNCNNSVDDSAIVCNNCGAHLAPQQPPKKKNTGKIIGIVAAVLVVLAIIGSVAQKTFQDMGYGDSGDNNDTPAFNVDSEDDNNTPDFNVDSEDDNNIADVKTYTKGAVVDNWYVNEWAGFRFDTTGWTTGTAEQYAAFESDPNTECGIILIDEKENVLSISFEKLTGANALISETAYLDIITDGLQKEYNASNISSTVSDYSDKTIAGETYKSVRVSLNDGLVIQDCFVLKLDGYMICISVTVQDGFDASSIINNIRTVE